MMLQGQKAVPYLRAAWLYINVRTKRDTTAKRDREKESDKRTYKSADLLQHRSVIHSISYCSCFVRNYNSLPYSISSSFLLIVFFFSRSSPVHLCRSVLLCKEEEQVFNVRQSYSQEFFSANFRESKIRWEKFSSSRFETISV